jgi:ferredoxin
MLGDKPCPQCHGLLGMRDEPARAGDPTARAQVRVYTCLGCAKCWESCPKCGGLVTEIQEPPDLFRPAPTSRLMRCLDCRAFHERRPLPDVG